MGSGWCSVRLHWRCRCHGVGAHLQLCHRVPVLPLPPMYAPRVPLSCVAPVSASLRACGHARGRACVQVVIQEVLPKAGLVYSEKGNLSEVLCKPKIMPIKSLTLEKLEELEKQAADMGAAAGPGVVGGAGAGGGFGGVVGGGGAPDRK